MSLDHTREWARALIRSGLHDREALEREIAQVYAADHPRARIDSHELVEEEFATWRDDAAGWVDPTDLDRLQRALAELVDAGFVVLPGCADHWAARRALQQHASRGALWFTEADVWHAIDEPMLEINLWHPDTANAAEGYPLLHEVLAVLHRHGLRAHFDEGRIEVAALWQARPPAQ